MISALNHQQPLSGNKLIALLILLLGGIACSASRHTQVLTNEVRAAEVIPADTIVPDKEKQEEEMEQQKGLVPEFANDFHIALLLPFSLHKDILPSSKEYKVIESVSDYYQGILLALEQLKKEGLIVTLHVYDSRMDSLVTVDILRKPEMASMDLIIGPLDHPSFAAASQFALSYEIPVIAPFAMLNSEAEINPLSFYCSPSLEAYGSEVARYLLAQKHLGPVLYFSDGSNTDKAFKRGFNAAQKENKIKLIERKIVTGMDPKPLLKKSDSLYNYILIPSDADKGVNMTLRSFKEAEDDGYPLIVVGLDSWLNFRDPEMGHWNKMNAIIATAYSVPDSSSNYRHFHSAFRAMHGIPPGEYALKGYDQMMHFGNGLFTFGKLFPSYIFNTEFEGVGIDFYWNNSGRAVQNRAVRLVQYQNFYFKQLK